MYYLEVMCRQKVDTPWSIYRDFTVAQIKCFAITSCYYHLIFSILFLFLKDLNAK